MQNVFLMLVRVSAWKPDIPVTSVCDFMKYCLWLVKIRSMLLGITLSKQVGDLIRLSKENEVSNCSILVFSAVILKSCSSRILSNSFAALVRQENRLFIKASSL